ncbi:MAG: hypothetical protein QXJ93_02510 [Candidatus Rehaiarchaeum fermentans]|nr:hypothetical protein [Candidatus Rehaiarchaeum fermentans]
MEHGRNGETYNIGTDTSTDFNTIFQIIKEKMNYKKETVYVTNQLKHYQRFTQADMAKTKKDLGFYPEYDIRKGVRKIIDSFY